MSDGPSAPAHPGAVLRRDFLEPLGLSANALALALRVPAPRISELVRGRRGMTPDTALRLARYFGTTPEFWLALQMAFDLEAARVADGGRIAAEVEPHDGGKAVRKALNKAVKRHAAPLKDLARTP